MTFLQKNIVKNLFLYFSAFVPMYFLIILRLVLDMAFDNIHSNWFVWLEISLLSAVILMGIVGLLSNTLYSSQKQEMTILIVQAKNITDKHFLGYFSIFILFALSFDFSHISMSCIFLCISIFVGIVYIKNKLFYINPLLNILGYSFFELTYRQDNATDTLKVFYKGDTLQNGINKKITVTNDKFGFIK